MDASVFINFISARSCRVLAIAPLARNQSLRARVSNLSRRDERRDFIDRRFGGCFSARDSYHRKSCRALWHVRSWFDSLVRAIPRKHRRIRRCTWLRSDLHTAKCIPRLADRTKRSSARKAVSVSCKQIQHRLAYAWLWHRGATTPRETLFELTKTIREKRIELVFSFANNSYTRNILLSRVLRN